MNERVGYYTMRIERQHRRTLFDGWRMFAWSDLNDRADFKTGVVRMTEQEMTLEWDASKGAVGRWLAKLEEAGYLRSGKLGETPRAGRYLVVVDVEERAKREWGKVWGKDGVIGGAEDGANKSSNGADDQDNRGAIGGAIGGAKPGQSLGHVIKKEKNQQETTTSVPSEPAAGAAPPPAQCELVPEDEPPIPPRPAAVADPLSEGAQRVVVALDSALKVRGDPGVGNWGAQRKMAENALRQGTPETEAIAAVNWGMGEERQRIRLRADGMKVLRHVWSDWKESGADERSNGGGSGAAVRGNAAAHRAGEGGSTDAGNFVVGGMATRYPDARHQHQRRRVG